MCLSISLKNIVADNLKTFACTDLGAFNRIGKNKLAATGISGIVIMEDRLPDFFIEYQEFTPNKDTTLNRHGPFNCLSTQQNLQDLIKELHEQNIKVFLGFWGQVVFNNNDSEQTVKWINDHPELWSLHTQNQANCDLDPLVILQPENIPFAQYIIRQFTKLKKDFAFDGLFLGDGLNGYRFFLDPNQYEDKTNTALLWTEFYRFIAEGVHQLDSQLLAYDCLGFSPERALLHGADYFSQAQDGLDYLFVQTYPTAWGKKWLKNIPGFDFNSTIQNLQKTKNKLGDTSCQVGYTLEMGDNIEDWQPSYWSIKKQLKAYRDFADCKLMVWANNLFYKILQ